LSLRDRVRDLLAVAEELAQARLRLDEALARVGEHFEGAPDAAVRLTERTTLVLRSSRLYVERRGERYALHDARVPTEVKVLVAHGLQALRVAIVDGDGEPRCLHHDLATNTLCSRVRPCAVHSGIPSRRRRRER
jgi:hypothetical protein